MFEKALFRSYFFMKKGTQQFEISNWTSDGFTSKEDQLVVEEPLEIRLGISSSETRISTPVAVTMRTPGADEKLALGFLFTEGILKNKEEVISTEVLAAREEMAKGNLLQINLKEGVRVDMKKMQRNFYTTSSCGICGKASIEAVMKISSFLIKNDLKINGEILTQLPKILEKQQSVFQATGGIHAAALFDVNGNLESIEEDVGRHNALDKLIGHAFLNNELPLSNKILLVSGRLGFELVQKAAMAGISFIAAVGAPTSLAVELAQESGMTIVGFLKEDRFNVYTSF